MRFLFTTQASNDLGLITRSLPIAHELVQRGHQVSFCNPAPSPRRLIAEAGFANFTPAHPIYYLSAANLTPGSVYQAVKTGSRDCGGFHPFVSKLIRALPRFPPGTPEVWSLDHFNALTGMLDEQFIRANLEAFTGAIQVYKPDGVVDFWNPYACLAARVRRIPLATVIQADLHPASRGFIWWKDPPPGLASPAPVVNQVLADYGLPAIEKTEELFSGDLVLVLGIPETDPLPEGANAHYVGPILWEKPGAQLPEWINQLPDDPPLIWVYSGNPRYTPVRGFWADSEIILSACFESLRNEDVQVILTTGHHALPRGTPPLPGNFRHIPFVPGLAMASRSRLLIHHGGYGSCQTGLYCGTPAVIVPTYSERESNARRVAMVGAGEFVLPVTDQRRRRFVPVDELRAKVRQVLSNPTYYQNAQRISREMRRYGGAVEAVRWIEQAFRKSSFQ